MELLEQSRDRLRTLIEARDLDTGGRVRVYPLSPDDAIGELADPDFVLRKGQERVIEACVGRARGQAFTDRPSSWIGTLGDALALDLSAPRARAVFVAVLNATLRLLGTPIASLHCRDEDPKRCGPVMADEIAKRFAPKRVGLIGLQPAILRALVDRFGVDSVAALDLSPERIGTWRSGVRIGDGERDLAELADWCDVGLVTGSSLVNGSIDEIHRRFLLQKKPVVYYGNTISGAALLLELERICPFGR